MFFAIYLRVHYPGDTIMTDFNRDLKAFNRLSKPGYELEISAEKLPTTLNDLVPAN